MAKVVTRRGDEGMTDVKGERISKTSPRIKLLAQLDEVNSLIGVYDTRPDLQKLIYVMSGRIAGYGGDLTTAILELEVEIWDLHSEDIQSRFIRPKSPLHLIRTAIRKAEIGAWEAGEGAIGKILNRLSDLYFIRAVRDEEDFGERF